MIEEGELEKALGTSKERRREPLSSTVRTALQLYFKNLDGANPASIYQMVIAEVERDNILQRVAGIASSCGERLSVLVDGKSIEVDAITHTVIGALISY